MRPLSYYSCRSHDRRIQEVIYSKKQSGYLQGTSKTSAMDQKAAKLQISSIPHSLFLASVAEPQSPSLDSPGDIEYELIIILICKSRLLRIWLAN